MSVTENVQMKIQHEISGLSEAISKLVDNLRSLKRPLVESRAQVPQATDQLDKISQQTEAATQQMLDKVEHVMQREEEIVNDMAQLKEKVLAGDVEAVNATAEAVAERANANLNDVYLIMDALQFQDITAQQMDHAASILEDIEGKLQNILSRTGDDQECVAEPGDGNRKKRAYDPHADLFNQKTKQEDIDTIFNEVKDK